MYIRLRLVLFSLFSYQYLPTYENSNVVWFAQKLFAMIMVVGIADITPLTVKYERSTNNRQSTRDI